METPFYGLNVSTNSRVDQNSPKDGTVFQLQITYPKGILTNTKGEPDEQEINYYFSVVTANTDTEQLEIKNDYFENTVDSAILLSRHQDKDRIITLPVPE